MFSLENYFLKCLCLNKYISRHKKKEVAMKYMVGGHHSRRNCIKGPQHYGGENHYIRESTDVNQMITFGKAYELY